MIHLFAHSAEFHDPGTTQAEHLLLTPLIYGLINLLLLIFVIGSLRLLKFSFGTQLLTTMALLLSGGIIGYQFIPAIGGILIALGIMVALGSVLLSIASSEPGSDN